MISYQGAFALTYYLDAVKGSDTTGDGSSLRPWKSLAKSQRMVHTGDNTIILRTGNYGRYYEDSHSGEISDGTRFGSAWENQIARNNWITYKADTGAVPVIASIDIIGQTTKYFNSYLKFTGIKVTGPVRPRYIKYWQFVGNTVDMSDPFERTNVIEVTADFVTFENNTITNCWIAADLHTVTGTVINNTMSNLGSYGIQLEGGSKNLVIERNNIYNIKNKYFDFVEFNANDGWISTNNLSIDNIEGVQLTTGRSIISYKNVNFNFSHILEMAYTLESSADIAAGALKVRFSTQSNGGTGGVYYDVPLPAIAANDLVHGFVRTLPDNYPGIDKIICKSVAIICSTPSVIQINQLRISDGIHTGIVGLWGTISNVKITRNIMHGVESQGLFLSRAGTYTGITFENNLLYDAGSNIVNIEEFDGSLMFRSNTIIGSYRYNSAPEEENYTSYCQIEFAPGYNGSGVKIYSNIIVGGLSIKQAGGTLTSKAWREDYNLVQSAPVFKGAHTIALDGTDKSFRTDCFVNPDFTRWTTALVDYRLKAGSIAINKVYVTYSSPTDFYGLPRDSQPDNGCYEKR